MVYQDLRLSFPTSSVENYSNSVKNQYCEVAKEDRNTVEATWVLQQCQPIAQVCNWVGCKHVEGHKAYHHLLEEFEGPMIVDKS